jgi:hypothetical protein
LNCKRKLNQVVQFFNQGSAQKYIEIGGRRQSADQKKRSGVAIAFIVDIYK